MEQDWIARGREVLDIEIAGLESVKKNINESFAQAVLLLGTCTGRVVITGIGKSGLVGRKLAATFSSTGTPSYFLHPVEGAHGDLGAIQRGDVVIAISYSGKSEELNAILPTLRSLGATIIAVTAGLTSPLAQLADVVLNSHVPREACPLNLAPTTSTTAALALGDALAVCLIDLKSFTAKDFKRFHPAGALGQRLSLDIASIMHTENLPIISPTTLAFTALKVMDKGKLGAALVVDDNKLVGILTDGDIRRKLYQGEFAEHAIAASLMTASPSCAFVQQSAAEVMDIMEQKSITVLPVVDETHALVGVVHLHDLLGKGQVKFAG